MEEKDEIISMLHGYIPRYLENWEANQQSIIIKLRSAMCVTMPRTGTSWDRVVDDLLSDSHGYDK